MFGEENSNMSLKNELAEPVLEEGMGSEESWIHWSFLQNFNPVLMQFYVVLQKLREQ